jgi:hypothetical protein
MNLHFKQGIKGLQGAKNLIRLYIYIYIYREREREREIYVKLFQKPIIKAPLRVLFHQFLPNPLQEYKVQYQHI